MCAIFGIVGEYDGALARRSVSLLSHRGPDYCGIVEKEGLFIAHNRLSIVDLSETASQPMSREGVILSFNGEIYNFQILKKELNISFQTNSDTEVVLAAYLKWGVGFVDHLEGMFAIALYDKGKLYLFRDRLGKKPLYYMYTDKQLVFASEIKGIIPHLKHKEMNKDALHGYLSFLAPTPPHTFYKGIEKLESGHFARYEKGRLEIKPYYDLLPSAITIRSEEEALLTIESALKESIRKRLMGDVEVASLLSGGVDSSLIAAMAAQMGTRLKTFSLGYEGYKQYDERRYAKEAAAHIGVENIDVQLSKKEFFENLDAVITALDEPINDPAAVPLYMLFKRIKEEGIKVVLSGEGADELFLGYRQYFEYLDIEKAGELQHKNWLKKYFRSNFSMNREWEWYKRIFNDELLFRSSGEKFTDMQKNILMRQNVKDGFSMQYLQKYRDRYEKLGSKDESQWYTYVDLKQFQAEHFLAKLDRVSMAHGIEGRTPFLDHKLVEKVFSIEPSLRYSSGESKALLKKVAAPYLPQSLINRKKKGFSSPYLEWLLEEGELECITRVNEQTGLFYPEVLDDYISRGRQGHYKQHLWGLYLFSRWYEKEFL
jgi:asparagine synthase (glutamine-hydrolysing)